MNHWEHLNQIPEPVRLTMSTAFATWERQDLGIETMVDLVLRDQAALNNARSALQHVSNRVRIPELCRVVHTAHPEWSWRDTFQAVALFTGLHSRHVARLFYGR